jgi:uncharacterized membrane protein
MVTTTAAAAAVAAAAVAAAGAAAAAASVASSNGATAVHLLGRLLGSAKHNERMCQGGSVGIGQSKVSGRSGLWILRRILESDGTVLHRILEPDGTEQREARWEAAKPALEGDVAFTDSSVLLLGRVLEDILEQRGGCRQRSVKVGPGLGAQRAHQVEHFGGGHFAPMRNNRSPPARAYLYRYVST